MPFLKLKVVSYTIQVYFRIQIIIFSSTLIYHSFLHVCKEGKYQNVHSLKTTRGLIFFILMLPPSSLALPSTFRYNYKIFPIYMCFCFIKDVDLVSVFKLSCFTITFVKDSLCLSLREYSFVSPNSYTKITFSPSHSQFLIDCSFYPVEAATSNTSKLTGRKVHF